MILRNMVGLGSMLKYTEFVALFTKNWDPFIKEHFLFPDSHTIKEKTLKK